MGRVQSPRVGAGSSFNLLVINERLKVDHKKYHYITVTVLPFICFAANLVIVHTVADDICLLEVQQQFKYAALMIVLK